MPPSDRREQIDRLRHHVRKGQVRRHVHPYYYTREPSQCVPFRVESVDGDRVTVRSKGCTTRVLDIWMVLSRTYVVPNP